MVIWWDGFHAVRGPGGTTLHFRACPAREGRSKQRSYKKRPLPLGATGASMALLSAYCYGAGATGQVKPLHAWAGPSSSRSSSPE